MCRGGGNAERGSPATWLCAAYSWRQFSVWAACSPSGRPVVRLGQICSPSGTHPLSSCAESGLSMGNVFSLNGCCLPFVCESSVPRLRVVCSMYARRPCLVCVSAGRRRSAVRSSSASRLRLVWPASGQHLRDLCATSLPHLRSVFAASVRGASARLCLAARAACTGRIRSDSLWIITPGGVMETLHWVKCPIEAE